MLLDWLAFGALGTSSGSSGSFTPSAARTDFITAGVASATVADTLPKGAGMWAVPLDPSDHAPYVFDWTKRLSDGEKVVTISRITVSPAAVLLGVQVDTDTTHAPAISSDGTQVSLWLDVDSSFQGNAAFAGDGIQVGIAMLVVTDKNPARSYERTMILTVRQQ